VPSAEKTQVSALFMRLLRAQTDTAPVFVTSKLIKVVVDMAVWDWGDVSSQSSSAYPTFFADVLSLLSTANTCGLGLSLLKVNDWFSLVQIESTVSTFFLPPCPFVMACLLRLAASLHIPTI
jgi:hypothetical protein